ncbi:MAG TPA: glycosyltransferase family 4 protein [Gemmatimonadaceae bacterium]|nr:glycosyltransferase family 4 protein [Gemmatimonadaceae bacterium]
MRILFYSQSPEWNGSARALAASARGMSERGHNVTVVCPPESALEQHLEFGAYEVVSLSTMLPAPVTAMRLRKLLHDRFIQVVVVNGAREQLIAALAARIAERAAVLRRISVGERLKLSMSERIAFRYAPTGLLFGSEEDKRIAPPTNLARFPAAVVPIGVNAQAYDAIRPASRASIGAPGGTRLLVSVYDRTGRARAATVLRVIALLAPRHPELRLALVGAGSDDEDLRMHAAALRVTGAVSFLGERDDYLSVLSVADLGWVVADGDNAVFALLDLLASRVPVLAERGTVAEQYVPDGIAGILLPRGEAPDIAAAVALLLGHDDRRAAMGGAGRARVSRDYSEQKMIDAFEAAATVASDRARW